MSREHDIRLLREALAREEEAVSRYGTHRHGAWRPRLVRRMLQDLENPGAVAKCPICPGRFVLRLDAAGDWALERRAP